MALEGEIRIINDLVSSKTKIDYSR